LPSMPVTLYQNHPNPFNPSTAIRFYLDRPGTAVVEIYDISGRLVRRLEEGHREAGYHRVEWNGADSRGIPVSSGIYLCRLRADKQVLTRKMVLLK
ncbi:MAG: FlgD immunoglobulin-like domain containing protein, partial [Candidatus Krumholzibacteria bacterium]|nr:FlgD immunoglobulin-like domain containing protein [Candidatus Krumholzibacteria bacterium]